MGMSLLCENTAKIALAEKSSQKRSPGVGLDFGMSLVYMLFLLFDKNTAHNDGSIKKHKNLKHKDNLYDGNFFHIAIF